MRLRIGRDALADAVAWAARALPTRPVIPILAGLMLEAGESDGLTLSCFDYDVSARVGADASVAEPGRVLVAGRLLAEIARSLPQRPVDLVSEGDVVVLSCGSARFTLLCLPADDFPALPTLPPPAGTIDGGSFATAVGQVAVAAGRDDTLPMLTGVHIAIDGRRMTLVATDRYRMAVRELEWQPADPGIQASALVPARTLADAAKTMVSGTVVSISLAADGLDRPVTTGAAPAGMGATGAAGLIGFGGGGRQLTTRLLGSEFVSYKSRFPRDFESRARLAAGPFGEAIRRVALVADRESRLLLTFAAGDVVIETGSGEGSRAVETVAAEFEGKEGFSIAFKPQYLLDGIGAASAGANARAGAQARAEADAREGAGRRAEADRPGGRDDMRGRQDVAGAEADDHDHTGAAEARQETGAVGGDTGPADTEPGAAEPDEPGRAGGDGAVILEFTSPEKPAVITGSPGFKYLLAPMRT
jgi:DNA polymerase-3 subunit beta